MFPIASAHELTCYCSLRSQQHASRHNSRFFCELCSQKTPHGMLPVNSNITFYILRYI